MIDSYILDDENRPIKAASVEEWARFYESPRRRVGDTTVGNYRISTVFLGIDPNWRSHGPPVLFESMAFDQDGNGVDVERYTSWSDAEAGHATMSRRWAKKGVKV